MASVSEKRLEDDRKKLETDTGLRLSQKAAYWCGNVPLTSIPCSSEVLVDPVALQKSMKEGLIYKKFEEDSPEHIVNLYKLGSDVCVQTTRGYADGEVVAMLGPNACLKGEEINVSETLCMEAAILDDKELVWFPNETPGDSDSIGNYVIDCHSLGIGASLEPNIDYHTVRIQFGVLSIPLHVLIANRDIAQGELVVGDFGESFFLEKRYMVPNLKSLVENGQTRKRKLRELEQEKVCLEDTQRRTQQELSAFRDQNERLYKKFKRLEPYENQNRQLSSNIASLEAQLRAERDAKEQLFVRVQELGQENKILENRLQHQYYTIIQMRQEKEQLMQQRSWT